MTIGLKLIGLVLLMFITTSCFKDDQCCPRDNMVLGLKFRYAQVTDTLQQATSSSSPLLAVFIFDDKGIFISQINDSLNKVDNDYIIKLPFTQAVTNL